MIKLISQDGKELFDLDKNNLFVCGNKILISDKVNIYESKAALLGLYNDEQEAENTMIKIIETFAKIPNVDSNFLCVRMPKAEERQPQQSNSVPPEVLETALAAQTEGNGVENAKDGE